MVARRVGKSTEIKVTAARAVKSGHIHEAGGSLFGYYAHGEDTASGEEIVVHTMEKLEIDKATGFAIAANGVVNFDLVNQQAVNSGGSNIGRAEAAVVSGDTKVVVILNNFARGHIA